MKENPNLTKVIIIIIVGLWVLLIYKKLTVLQLPIKEANELFPTSVPTINYNIYSKKKCIEKGGIIIESAWDNRIVDCKFR